MATGFPPAGVQTYTSLAGTEYVPISDGSPLNSQAPASLVGGLWSKVAIVDQSAGPAQAVTNAFNVTVSATQSTLFLSLTQTAAAGTVTLPAAPVNGQIARFSISADVTALSVTASHTVNSRTALSASTASAGGFSWIYSGSDTTWYRF